jgi:hypothetical protein
MLILPATVLTVVNYDRNTFILQATGVPIGGYALCLARQYRLSNMNSGMKIVSHI